MKTKIEWRHGDRVLKLADTDYEGYPEDGDIIELEEDGETYRFQVQGTESAVVLLEIAADDAVGPNEKAPRMPVEDVKTVAPVKQASRKFKVATKKKK